MYRLRTVLYILFILVVFRNLSRADDHSNARTIGMSKAGMVTSYGVDAFGLNPANYDFHLTKSPFAKDTLRSLSKKHAWEISMLSFGGGYGSDSSIDFYNNYLKYLSVNRTTFTNIFTDLPSVLDFRSNVLPGEQTQVNYEFELKWLSINFTSKNSGAFNFTIADRVGLNTNAYSRDQEMPLTFGYAPHENGSYDLTNVIINQAEATAWWLRKYTIGYGKQFDFKSKSGVRSFSIGAAVGLVHGYGNIITRQSTLTMNSYGVKRNSNNINHVDSISGKQDFYTESALTDFFRDYEDGHTAHFNFFPKPAGTGYCIDLGMTMQIGDAWRLAISVTDIGQVTWNYNTFINKDNNSFIYKNFDLVSTDPTYNQFVNDLEGINTRDSVTNYSTNMPTKYRAGFAFQPSKKFMLEFDWVKGDNNLPGNTTDNVFSLGSEYFPTAILPLRTGITVGGPGSFYVAFGTGVKLNNLTLDIATNGINQLIMNKRFSISFSTKLAF